MKKILGTLVVVALILGSSSALAAPGRTSKAMEVRQAADRAIEGPTFIRAAMDSMDRMWDSIVKAIVKNIGNIGSEFAVTADVEKQRPRRDTGFEAPALMNIGNTG